MTEAPEATGSHGGTGKRGRTGFWLLRRSHRAPLSEIARFLATPATTGVILHGSRFAAHTSMLADVPYNKTTGSIIEAAIEVHRALGPGLLESTYMTCLHYELSQRGLRFDCQRAVPIYYKQITWSAAYRIDLIVEDLIVVEVKAVERLMTVHEAQVLTYLIMTNTPAGLLINFNVPKLLDGLKRVINSKYVAPTST